MGVGEGGPCLGLTPGLLNPSPGYSKGVGGWAHNIGPTDKAGPVIPGSGEDIEEYKDMEMRGTKSQSVYTKQKQPKM